MTQTKSTIVTLFVNRRLSISFSFVTVVHAIMKTQIAPHGMIVSLQITTQNIINDNINFINYTSSRLKFNVFILTTAFWLGQEGSLTDFYFIILRLNNTAQ